MVDLLYYLGVTADSVLSVFGVRSPYEHPKYAVVGHIGDDVELRRYGERVAVETPVHRANDGEAFGRLFRYITGANAGTAKIAMTVPVEQGAPRKIAMTLPVELSDADETMRFFLPRKVAAHPPQPTDPQVHIVTLPPQKFAVLRFSGVVDDNTRQKQQARLMQAVAAAGLHADGPPSLFTYDPPFALPFVRRNEVAVPVAGGAN